MSVQLTSDHSIRLVLDPGESSTIYNLGPAIAYVGTGYSVSPTSFSTTIAAGATLTVTASVYLIAGPTPTTVDWSEPALPAPTGGGTSAAFVPYVNAKAEGCKGDGSTDDQAALQAAVTKAAGGVLFLPKGVYNIAVKPTQSINVTGSLTILGEGDGSVIQHFGTATSSANAQSLFECQGIGSRVVFDSVKMVGPTLSGASATALNTAVFHSSTTTGTIVVRNSYITGFVYAIRTWDSGTHRVEVSDSRIEGANFVTPGSMGINFPGGVGAELICDNVDFSKTGENADHFHNHCVYMYEPVSAHFSRCRFDNVKGRYVQWFSGVGRPKYARFTDCYFGPNIDVDVQGVMTNNQTPTTFENCTFDHPGNAVECQGDVTFTNCQFQTTANTTFYPAISCTAAGARITVNGGIWPIVQQFIFKLEVANVRLKVANVVFTGAPLLHISCRSGSAGSLVEVENCTFVDNQATGAPIDLQAVVTVTLRGNRFQTTRAAVLSNIATPTLNALFNDFSQTGATLSGTAPTAGKRVGNYGTVGLADQ